MKPRKQSKRRKAVYAFLLDFVLSDENDELFVQRLKFKKIPIT